VADPLQIKDMDAKQIAERQIVERYLANALSEQEAEDFEAYVETHPEVTREIELLARMKSGLATLRDRGELREILEKPAPRAFKPMALIAASVAALAVAAILLTNQRASNDHSPLMAALSEELSISSRLVLVRTRGDFPPALAHPHAGTAAEFEITPQASAATDAYSVALFRLEGPEARPVGQPQPLTTAANGRVRFYVRAEALTPGDYLVRLAGGDDETEEFLFKVAP
jgi:hypothetical protein